MYELDFDFGNCEDIYKGNETADELAYQATKTSLIRNPFPTSSKILFLGKMNHKGHLAPIPGINHHTPK